MEREDSREEGPVSRIFLIQRILAGLAGRVVSYRFAIAAFLIPLTIRAIPEIIAGPYPIEWDTVAVVGYYLDAGSRPA